MMKIQPSKIEYVKYHLNFIKPPFCPHLCDYCYMQLLRRRFYKNTNTFTVDMNTKELLSQLKNGFKPEGDIFLSSSHDFFVKFIPFEYNGQTFAFVNNYGIEYVDTTFQLQREIFAIFFIFRDTLYNKIRILTKAKEIPFNLPYYELQVKFGYTITTLDQKLANIVEPNAAPIGLRIGILQQMALKGVPIWISVEPMLQGMDLLRLLSFFDREDLKLTEVWVGPLNHYVKSYAMPLDEIVRQFNTAKQVGYPVIAKDYLVQKAQKAGLELEK